MRRKYLLILAVIIVACSGQSRTPDGTTASRFERLFVPQDHSQIVVYARALSPITLPLTWKIRKVALNRADGSQVEVPNSEASISLSGIVGGQKLLLVSEADAGDFSGISIFTDDVISEVDGRPVPTETSIVMIDHAFTIVPGNTKTLNVLIDWKYTGNLKSDARLKPEFSIEEETASRARRLLYVSNEGSSNISVIDRDLKRVIHNVFVGTKPFALAADRRRKRIYIADREDGVLYEMDMVGSQLTRATEIEFVDEPVHIEPVPQEDVYLVLNYGSHRVYIMDSFTSEIIETIDVPEQPIDAVYSPFYDRVFVLCQRWGMLAALDVSTRPVVVDTTFRVEQQPMGLAIDDTAEWLFISNSGSIDFTVFEIRRMAVERTLPIGTGAGDVVFDPSSRRLYIGMIDTREILCLDPFTGVMVFRTSLPTRPGKMYFEAEEKKLYVTLPKSNAVAVVDPITQQVSHWIETGIGPTSVTAGL
jgi:YVTN family beta-propeller protein